MVELESHRNIIKDEIPEGSKRDKSIKRLERKINVSQHVNNYRLKLHDRYLEYTKKRNERLRNQDNVKKNEHVLEIPGCPPQFLTYLEKVIQFFKQRWTPGLTLREDFLSDFTPDFSRSAGIVTQQKYDKEESL